ncbi:MAG TPA: CopD family protein [Oleiagrimonas sp.]|nr:CopD family protein [Oleiagrimonas sp.]
MLWLKAFHIIFVVTWFAGLFYLPRLFIYHVEATEPVLRERFKVMERRLLGITHIGAALAVVFGLSLVGWWEMHSPGYLFAGGWFTVKLVLVALLIAYHVMLARMTGKLKHDALDWSSRKLRLFNEIPALLLIGIVIMVVVKPI